MLVEKTDGEHTTYVTVPVYYRVVETESESTAYGSTVAGPFSYENAKGSENLSVAGTVTNSLKETVKVNVQKVWTDNKYGDLAKYMPVEIYVQLQYRAGDGDAWADVLTGGRLTLNEEGGWFASYSGLRADLQYRVIEAGILYADGIYDETIVVSDSGTIWTARSNHFDIVAESEFINNGEGEANYGCVITNTVKRSPDNPETGVNDHAAFYMTMATVSVLGLAMIGVKKRRIRED